MGMDAIHGQEGTEEKFPGAAAARSERRGRQLTEQLEGQVQSRE